jgi:hypothetical protein
MTAERYPYREGETVVLGPEVFAGADEQVICWRGMNYVPQRTDRSRVLAELRRDIHEALVVLSAPEADRVRRLIARLEAAAAA